MDRQAIGPSRTINAAARGNRRRRPYPSRPAAPNHPRLTIAVSSIANAIPTGMENWLARLSASIDVARPSNRRRRRPSYPESGVLQRTATGIVVGYISGHRFLPSTTALPGPGEQLCGQIVSYSYNNCCQYYWQCNNDQDWAAGYHAFQTNRHCALPGLVSIVGDPDFVDFYAGRLDELRNRLPHRYDYVLNGLDRIQQDWHREDNAGQAAQVNGHFMYVDKTRWTDGRGDPRQSFTSLPHPSRDAAAR